MNEINNVNGNTGIRDLWAILNENRLEQQSEQNPAQSGYIPGNENDDSTISMTARGFDAVQNRISPEDSEARNGLRAMITSMVTRGENQVTERFFNTTDNMSREELSGFAGQAGAVAELDDQNTLSSWMDQFMALRERNLELGNSFAAAVNNILEIDSERQGGAPDNTNSTLRSVLAVSNDMSRREEDEGMLRDFLNQVSNAENTTNLSLVVSQSFQRLSGDQR